MRRKLEILIIFLALACMCQAYVPSQVYVNSSLKFYGGNCTDNIYCTSNYCLNSSCACLVKPDCVYGGYCSAGACINNASIYTEFNVYSHNTTITITGNNYYPNSVITLVITNSSGGIVTGFPVNVTINSTGSFVYNYAVTAPNGSYTIIGDGDFRYLDYANKTVLIESPYRFYGRIINPFNGTVPSVLNVYYNGTLIAVDDEVYDLIFNYGKKYDIVIKPNISSIKQLLIHWIANQGHVGDIIGFDEAPGTTNYSKIVVFYPLITNYDDIVLTLVHLKNLTLYKCADWNFTGRKCKGNWIKLGAFLSDEINLTFAPGDPGIGIEKVTAGGKGRIVVGGITRTPYSPGGIAKLGNLNEALLIKTCLGIDQKVYFYVKSIKYAARLTGAAVNSSTIEIDGKSYVMKLDSQMKIDLDNNGMDDTKIYFDKVNGSKTCYEFYELKETATAGNITEMLKKARTEAAKVINSWDYRVPLLIVLVLLLIIFMIYRELSKKQAQKTKKHRKIFK